MPKIAPILIQDGFRTFLLKLRVEDVPALMEYAEQTLFVCLKECAGFEGESLYDLSDSSLCQTIRQRMQSQGELKDRNDAENNHLSQTLQLYADYLGSKFYPTPKLVKQPKKGKNNTTATAAPAPPVLPKETELTEGGKQHVEGERRYRNPQLRQLCIAKYGFVCQVCGLNFETIYGEAGKNYIEVHHLRPISTYEDEHQVDPQKDLVPLCANCHSMIHHLPEGEEHPLRKLREIYQGPTWEIKELMED